MSEQKMYIGTKLVRANPAWRVQEMGKEPEIVDMGCGLGCYEKGTIIREGYRVEYGDGYRSWSPKEVFEEAYNPTDGLTFGQAMHAVTEFNMAVRRKAWTDVLYMTRLEGSCGDFWLPEDIYMVRSDGTVTGDWSVLYCDTAAHDWEIVEMDAAPAGDHFPVASGMTFGMALEAVKRGRKIARAGWNGKDQHVELGVNFRYETPYSGEEHSAHHLDMGSQALVFVGTRGRQVGWLASQADMLADDWMIVE